MGGKNMFELNKKRTSDDVDLLFSDWYDDMTLLALEEGKTDAHIYVDNLDFAHVAIILRGFRMRLAGDPLEPYCVAAVKDFFDNVLVGNTDPNMPNYLIIYYQEPEWQDVLLDILSKQNSKYFARTYYRLNMLDHIPDVSLPEGHRYVNIQEVYNTMQDYKNYDIVVKEMQSEISTPEKFLKYCFGICSVKDHTITGWTMAEYVNLSGCEVGFGVAEDYREQGIAAALVSEFMRMARDRGLQYVGWSSYKHNTFGAEVVQAAGMKHTKDYPCIYVDL